MQSAQGSSKGKGKAKDEDGDYSQSFASLSLSDHGDLAPLSNSYGSSYPGSSYPDIYGSSHDESYPADDHHSSAAPTRLARSKSSKTDVHGSSHDQSYPTNDHHGSAAPISPARSKSSYKDVYGSSYDQSYPTNNPYGYDAPISLAPTQSSSSAYSSTLGHGTPYASTSASVSTGGYEYQSNPYGTSNYSSYATYGPVSVASISAPASYGGGSVGGWSDAQTPTALSAPSASSNQSNINNSINRQRPPNKQYQLPCEFRNLTGCDRTFPGHDVQGWMDHVEGHLQSKFPTRLRCCK